MKKIIIFAAVIVAGYFGYNYLTTSTGSSQSVATTDGQGAITQVNDSINNVISETRDTVAKVSLTAKEIEEQTTDLTETDVKVASDTKDVAAPGNYLAYGDTDISSLEGDIVLDFYAAWCPSCRKLEADIKDSLGDIPADLSIVKVNYDTQTDLKSKYGVTKQHTLVQVDQQGNLIKKWSGGSTLESIVSNLE